MNSEFEKVMIDVIKLFQVIAEKAAPIVSCLAQFHNTTTKISKYLPALERQSWFFSFSISLENYPRLAAAAEEGDEPKLIAEIESIYRLEIGNMGAELCSLFPKRASQIFPACQAHSRSEYALSIPMFLIAAAGICRDALKTDLFAQGNFKKTLAKILNACSAQEKTRTEYEAALLRIFDKTVKLAMSVKPDEISSHFDVNRHLVLHGTALPEHYGTEINSLKAFSFLATVASVLRIIEAD